MPGWYDAWRKLDRLDELQFAGIVQEQHGERARLFMQWKQMDFPLMVDAMDLLDVGVVPITLLIDEYGTVRARAQRQDDPATQMREFLAAAFEAPPETEPPDFPSIAALEQEARRGTAESYRRYAEALFLWGGPLELSGSIAAFEKAASLLPDDPRIAFRLGVAYRARHDTKRRRVGDFRRAAEAWTRAIELDPDNYIWRRRIQQYGPRSDQPYPFYDWVETARAAIRGHGERPIELSAEPAGAELAQPANTLPAPAAATNPDPQGKILRDRGELIGVVPALVPARLRPGQAARIHLEFNAEAAPRAHWNNEQQGLLVWLDPPPGVHLDSRSTVLPNPTEAISTETRRIEFELRLAEDARGSIRLPGYALYYVCEGRAGQCLYRRQDFSIEIPVRDAE